MQHAGWEHYERSDICCRGRFALASLCPGPNALGCVTPRLLDRSIQVKPRSGSTPPSDPSCVFSLAVPGLLSHPVRPSLRLSSLGLFPDETPRAGPMTLSFLCTKVPRAST